MAKFTKGPWVVAKGEHYACVKSGGGVICDARIVNSVLPSTADLNLIAAAPDLYEALSDVVDFISALGYENSDQYQAAVYTLAKVRGEQ